MNPAEEKGCAVAIHDGVLYVNHAWKIHGGEVSYPGGSFLLADVPPEGMAVPSDGKDVTISNAHFIAPETSPPFAAPPLAATSANSFFWMAPPEKDPDPVGIDPEDPDEVLEPIDIDSEAPPEGVAWTGDSYSQLKALEEEAKKAFASGGQVPKEFASSSSSWDNPLSASSAYGLMQVMPASWPLAKSQPPIKPSTGGWKNASAEKILDDMKVFSKSLKSLKSAASDAFTFTITQEQKQLIELIYGAHPMPEKDE